MICMGELNRSSTEFYESHDITRHSRSIDLIALTTPARCWYPAPPMNVTSLNSIVLTSLPDWMLFLTMRRRTQIPAASCFNVV
jgi:hypothetical protein